LSVIGARDGQRHDVPHAGLCNACTYQRLVPNTRGSLFSLCERSKLEPQLFARYPRLPVSACRGYLERSRADDD
jgi:hypothetical protein